MARYLINSTSEQSAGWYPDDTARVLLDGLNNWSEAEPPPEDGGGLDLELLNDDERKQYEALQEGHVLTEADLHPELVPPVATPPIPVTDPDPGPASDATDPGDDTEPPTTPADSSADTTGGTADNEGK